MDGGGLKSNLRHLQTEGVGEPLGRDCAVAPLAGPDACHAARAVVSDRYCFVASSAATAPVASATVTTSFGGWAGDVDPDSIARIAPPQRRGVGCRAYGGPSP